MLLEDKGAQNVPVAPWTASTVAVWLQRPSPMNLQAQWYPQGPHSHSSQHSATTSTLPS